MEPHSAARSQLSAELNWPPQWTRRAIGLEGEIAMAAIGVAIFAAWSEHTPRPVVISVPPPT